MKHYAAIYIAVPKGGRQERCSLALFLLIAGNAYSAQRNVRLDNVSGRYFPSSTGLTLYTCLTTWF